MRLIVESGNVRGSKCKPRSYVPEMKTQGHGYRADLELRDRSRGVTRGLDTLWKLHWVLLS